MATATHTKRYRQMNDTRTGIQKVCAGMGMGFVILGFVGIIMPGMMGMHLSFAHNFIHLASGALALWAGYSDGSRRAYAFCIGFGSVYAFLGLAGFIFGEPGYPGVGQMRADENLLRIIPNVLEFASTDHGVHLFISAILLVSAITWKRSRSMADRALVDVQRRRDRVDAREFIKGTTTRPDSPNSTTDLPDAELGRSDVNRPSDIKRRDDFERRV